MKAQVIHEIATSKHLNHAADVRTSRLEAWWIGYARQMIFHFSFSTKERERPNKTNLLPRNHYFYVIKRCWQWITKCKLAIYWNRISPELQHSWYKKWWMKQRIGVSYPGSFGCCQGLWCGLAGVHIKDIIPLRCRLNLLANFRARVCQSKLVGWMRQACMSDRV